MVDVAEAALLFFGGGIAGLKESLCALGQIISSLKIAKFFAKSCN